MVDFKDVIDVKIPEGSVNMIKADGTVVWRKNWVRVSTDESGDRYSGTGYKSNTRVRSGGLETEESVTACTGYIPVKAGDTVYIYPMFNGKNVINAINYASENHENLGQVTYKSTGALGYGICAAAPNLYAAFQDDERSRLNVTSAVGAQAKYIRVTNEVTDGDGANMRIYISPFTNVFDASNVTLNKRYSVSSGLQDATGWVICDTPVNIPDTSTGGSYVMRVKGLPYGSSSTIMIATMQYKDSAGSDTTREQIIGTYDASTQIWTCSGTTQAAGTTAICSYQISRYSAEVTAEDVQGIIATINEEIE